MVVEDAPPKTMYKRPIPRVRGFAPQAFVSEAQPGGGVRSQWVGYTNRARVASGTPGVAGAIIDKMRNPNPVCPPVQREWTPPQEFEFGAKYMSAEQRGPWLQKCRAWFEAQPKQAAPRPTVESTVDHQLIAAMYTAGHRVAGGPTIPPIATRVKVYRAAGCSEELLAKAKARAARLEATCDERQKALDLIFAKWPAASKAAKTKVKAKPKVIKAVKKKL